MTITVYIKANKLTEEANIINKKNEPLLYYLTNSSEKGIYKIEYKGEEVEIPCEAHELKVEQGIIDEIKIIIYDGKNYNIYDQMNDDTIHEFIEEYDWNNCSLVIKTEANFTHQYNDIIYDYFFIYIKSGDGLERIDLAYTGIDIKNKIVSKPIITDMMSLIKINDVDKDDLSYYEMLEVYKKLLNDFSDLLKMI